MGRGDQLSRQWRLIQMLFLSKAGKTVSGLAQAAGCTTRTVYRDLEALQAAGFPLVNETIDGNSRWSVLDSFKNQPPLFLSATEVMALYFSRDMLSILKGTVFHDALTTLFDKLQATLSPETLKFLSTMGDRLSVVARPHKSYEGKTPVFEVVNQAITESKAVDMDYFSMSRREAASRRVFPYRVYFYDNTFYLIGYCRLREGVRTFALDRIRDIRLTEEIFEIPPDFCAESFLQKSFGIFTGKPVTVTIRFTPEAAGYIRERKWHETQRLKDQPDGSVVFEATVAGVDEILTWVLGWGAKARALSPPSFVKRIEEEIGRMRQNYKTKE